MKIVYLFFFILLIGCKGNNGIENNKAELSEKCNFNNNLFFIGFDSLTNRQKVDSQYHNKGISFSLKNGNPRTIDRSYDFYDAIPSSYPHLLGGDNTTGIDPFNPLTIYFDGLASNISFHVIDVESGGSIELYDSNDILLDTRIMESLSSGDSQVISFSIQKVSKIIFINNDGFFLDNLSYNISCE